MKTIVDRWKGPLLFGIFYIFAAGALIAPISSDSFVPALADYINHLSGIIQAKMALSEGQFPIRIAPSEQSGWRYPYYQFYSPSVYLISALIYKWLTPFNPLVAYKITVWGSLVVGGIYMERLAYWFVKSRPAALLASLVYLFSPYYIVVINNFADLSEIMALALVPAVLFYSLQQFCKPTHKKLLLQMGVCWYLLITIHIVTFIYTALFLGCFLILLTARNRHHLRNCISVFIALSFGALLAMWYLAPIALLGNDVLVSQTFAKSANFMTFHPVISQLLFSGALQFKKELVHNHPGIGWTILISVGICGYALFHRPAIHSKRANYLMPTLLFLFFFAFLLTWSPLNFWQWLPSVFMVGQYSWRFLGQVIWIGTLLFAWALCWVFKNDLSVRHVVIGILLIATVSNVYFPTINSSNIDLKKFIKNPFFIYNQNAYSINFNKNTHYVETIDTMVIYALMAHNTLQLNEIYTIPQSLIHFAKVPMIALVGEAPAHVRRDEQIIALINNVPIGHLALQPGPFRWNISLNDQILSQFIKSSALNLKFITKSGGPLKIPVKKVVLTGFLAPAETLTVDETQPFCHQQKTHTVCQIKVPDSINLIELPVLYYPKLLAIKLNGKKASYQSVVYLDSLLTAIKPEAGKPNRIDITFRGLVWANTVSWLAWGLALLLAGRLLLRRFFWRGDQSFKK